MLFGWAIPIPLILTLGVTLFLLISFQVSLGLRWVKLDPRYHFRVHRINGITIWCIGVVHGTLALLLFGSTLFTR